jgi:hypothetical protein
MLECHAGVCLTGAGEACGFHGYAIGWIDCYYRIYDVRFYRDCFSSSQSRMLPTTDEEFAVLVV